MANRVGILASLRQMFGASADDELGLDEAIKASNGFSENSASLLKETLHHVEGKGMSIGIPISSRQEHNHQISRNVKVRQNNDERQNSKAPKRESEMELGDR